MKKNIAHTGSRNIWVMLFLAFLFLGNEAFAQENVTVNEKKNWLFGVKGHTGFLMNHHNNVRGLNEKRPYAFEVYAGKKTYGSKDWHAFFNYPEYGVSYVLYNMGSPSYLGLAHGLAPYMNFFLLDKNNTFNLNIKVGAGAAYVQKTFDRKNNYKNASISSHINAFINMQAGMDVQLSEHWSANLGLALIHLSNGSFKKPNAGLNFLSAYGGLSYALSNPSVQQPIANSEFSKKWQHSILLSGGIKEISPIGGRKYLQTGLSYELARKHSSFTQYSGTVDVFHSFSDYHALHNNDVYVSRLQTTKLGATLGYELFFGRLSANFQAGAYIYAKNTEDGIMYQRLALRYAVTKRLKVHFGLKTQMGQADYIEMALGYRL